MRSLLLAQISIQSNDLIEHEWDYVLIGYFDGIPKLNPEEAIDFRFMPLDDVKADAKANPQHYTTWFKLILEQPELSSLQTT
jgi:isopentenyl-diphosphate Delta-isomerase